MEKPLLADPQLTKTEKMSVLLGCHFKHGWIRAIKMLLNMTEITPSNFGFGGGISYWTNLIYNNCFTLQIM